jgi:hypothetical protein
MSAIDLPDVTVVTVGDAAEALTQLALDRTLNEISPASIIWNREPIDSMEEADTILWRTCARVKTSHALVVQYDGFVLDGSMWKPEFLEYDYIGAPWPHQQLVVGNGGFSLRSKKLMQFLVENAGQFPVATPEDSVICLDYRPALEKEGFRFAPGWLAHQFSFERCPKRRSLGFHGIWNVSKVMSSEKCAEWMGAATDYVKGKSEWQELLALVA